LKENLVPGTLQQKSRTYDIGLGPDSEGKARRALRELKIEPGKTVRKLFFTLFSDRRLGNTFTHGNMEGYLMNLR
jgi:hypothetical protein